MKIRVTVQTVLDLPILLLCSSSCLRATKNGSLSSVSIKLLFEWWLLDDDDEDEDDEDELVADEYAESFVSMEKSRSVRRSSVLWFVSLKKLHEADEEDEEATEDVDVQPEPDE